MGLLMLNGIPYSSTEQPATIYSSEEREVGVWTDGKPLYQKTIEVPISSITGDETTINHLISDVDNIYIASGCALRSGNLTLPLVTYHTSSSWAVSAYNFTRTSFILYLGSEERSRVLKVILTVNYTKTTDQPGSGQWLPSGEKSHHYSETEQVVGTWIDGKPVYEKTFSATFSTSATELVISLVANIHKIINVTGFLIPSDTPTNTVAIGSNGLDMYNCNAWSCTIKRGGGDWWGTSPTVYVIIRYTKSTD